MTARLAERLGWWMIPLGIIFWVILWPVGIAWGVVAWIRRRRAMPREERLLRLYPRAWRERYGEEFAELLRESLADGRGGLGLTLDVWRGALEAHRDAALSPQGRAIALLTACWIPLFPQGLVALGFLAFDAPVRSWFVALYLPEALGYAVALGMVALGSWMLVRGARAARRLQLLR
jgi:hypothetical protein